MTGSKKIHPTTQTPDLAAIAAEPAPCSIVKIEKSGGYKQHKILAEQHQSLEVDKAVGKGVLVGGGIGFLVGDVVFAGIGAVAGGAIAGGIASAKSADAVNTEMDSYAQIAQQDCVKISANRAAYGELKKQSSFREEPPTNTAPKHTVTPDGAKTVQPVQHKIP